ncbi:MAG: SUMF1/EgtB/PvdO family nonheme iron enzyme [Nitrospinaceae bacterium]
MTSKPVFPKRTLPVAIVLILFSFFNDPGIVFGEIENLIEEGEKSFASDDVNGAEKIFSKAVEINPEGYRALKALAEIKVLLEKYDEANVLIDQLLALEVTGGRKVLVYFEGEPQPLEAELIDETVVKDGVAKSSMGKFIKPIASGPVEHYRLFFKKSGRVELLPKNQVQIKYVGIPRILRERVVELQEKVKKKLIATAGGGKREKMADLEGGCFMMGSTKGDADESPIHEVCVSPFKMDKYEVTQRKFQFVLNRNPSHFQGAELPVDSVTWMDANEYCKKLGKRLPTEAEWEFAARAGTATEYYWGEDFDPKMGNLCDSTCKLNVRSTEGSDGFKQTAPVGSFPPNPFGLYDMAGNVSEWVWDSYHEGYYFISPKKDPKGYLPPQTEKTEIGPEEIFLAERSASRKVVRGGAWENDFLSGRSASRKVFYPGYRIEGVGFRCAAGSS